MDEYRQQSPNPITEQEIQKLRTDVIENYRIHVEIHGNKGEFIASDSPSVFQEKRLPDFVTSVKFDNTFFFHTLFKLNPCCILELQFDFNKPPLIDFITNPSFPTPNTSSLHILSENDTWAEGAHEKIMSFLRERRTHRAWLHRKNIYDLLSILFFLPLTLWNLHKFDFFAADFFSKHTSVFTVTVYIYIFIIVLTFFRFVFNYLRWIFPYQELRTSLKNRFALHRLIFVTLLTGVTVALAKDFFIRLIYAIF
jgi:hypothetical protein